jgi:MOB kinase activator 1
VLPEGEDANEWIAVHGAWAWLFVLGERWLLTPRTPGHRRPVVDFFNHINMLYGTVTEFCNPSKVRMGAYRRETSLPNRS